MSEDLYWRLHSLSKCLEGSGRIDEHDMPDAYSTILDAMKAVRTEPEQEPVASLYITPDVQHAKHCASLTRLLLSDPPQRARCDCGAKGEKT